MAGIYYGHLLEFPLIRVDSFTAPRPHWQIPHERSLAQYQPPPARLFLLTHTHSDHVVGLSDKEFTGQIVCSADTKRMLLDLEPETERLWRTNGIRERDVKRFGALRPKETEDGHLVDRIKALPYGQPTEFDLGYHNNKEEKVTITLIDANHCPGSAMFLIVSDSKAVLHTGDVRADRRFIDFLKREPALQQYLAPSSVYKHAIGKVGGGRKILNRIYLDTAAMLGTGDMADREEVLQELVDIMACYPPDTVFFLNVWCFGWEHVIKEVSRYFNEKIHVDRYKKTIYRAVRSDPFLSECTTLDPLSSRFHACERFAKCEGCRRFAEHSNKPVYNLDKLIVHVNMVEGKMAGWEFQKKHFMERLYRAQHFNGGWPFNIDVPISRHSSLPELQALIKLFRPLALTPNTAAPFARGLDYYLLPEFFSDSLSPGTCEKICRERDQYLGNKWGEWYIQGLDLLRRKGQVLLPDLEKMAKEEHYYKREDRLHDIDASPPVLQKQQGPLGANRPDISRDQITRAGGLPDLSPQEVYLLVCAMMEKTPGGKDLKTKKAEEDQDMDYETEEESMRQRKRLRFLTSSPPQSQESQDCVVLAKQPHRKSVNVDVPAKVAGCDSKPAHSKTTSTQAKKEPTSTLVKIEKDHIRPNPAKEKAVVSVISIGTSTSQTAHHQPSKNSGFKSSRSNTHQRTSTKNEREFNETSGTSGRVHSKRSMSQIEMDRIRERMSQGGGAGLGRISSVKEEID